MSVNPVFTDGCVRDNNSAHIWDIATGPPLYVAGKGRNGVPGLRINSSFGYAAGRLFINNPTTLIAKVVMQWSALPTGNYRLVSFSDGTSAQITLYLLPSGQLQFARGSTLIGSPTALTYPPNVLNDFEVKVFVDPTVGTAECRVNGNTTPVLTFSGNTRSTANSYANRIVFDGGSTTVEYFLSDIVLFDCGGGSPNNFIGNKRVQTLVPTADSATGGLNQFSTQPSQVAGDHYKNVDETPPDDDTSYNYDATATNRESYQISPIVSGATGIVGVNISARVRNDDATPHTYKIVSRSNAVDSLSSDINPAASYRDDTFWQATDPNTSVAWLEAGVNASEIGIEITS